MRDEIGWGATLGAHCWLRPRGTEVWIVALRSLLTKQDAKICVKFASRILIEYRSNMMKTGFKYGFGLLAGLVFSVAAMASEPTPIADRDAFEKEYIDCIMSGLKGNCIVSIFSAHRDPRIDDADETLDNLSKYYSTRMKPVYKVHSLDKITRAGIIDSRTYLIEFSDGTLSGAYVVFRKNNGAWYVFRFFIGGAELAYKLLDLPTMPIE
jgi:hypothetical protein